jgi:cardiolipin synthase A/B
MADSEKQKKDGLLHRRVEIPLTVIIVALLLIALLGVLLWSVLNHRSFHLQTEHRGALETDLFSIAPLTGGSLVEGNAAEIGHNGSFFDRLMSDIEGAEETVHLETYVWWKGEVCRELATLLASRAREGVEVRLLIDWAGSRRMERGLVPLMRNAGAEVEFFRPLSLRNLGRINFRTHRKIAVIDGRTAYIFGHGIAQEWTGNAENREQYRDTFVRVQGPIVNQIQGAFFENWLETTRRLPLGPTYFPRIDPVGEATAHVAYANPMGGVSAAETLHYGIITAATREIFIQNPYFVVDPRMIQTFEKAVARGVVIRVMIPSVTSTDNPIVQHASHRYLRELLEAGVEIWEYEKTLLHQKVMIVDGIWSSIGSTNFDDRSFELNDEIQLGILDPEIALQLKEAWADDLRFARKVELAEWNRRSLWHRLKDRMAYLIKEQL